MDWKKPLCGKKHADDFPLSMLISAYNKNAKVEFSFMVSKIDVFKCGYMVVGLK